MRSTDHGAAPTMTHETRPRKRGRDGAVEPPPLPKRPRIWSPWAAVRGAAAAASRGLAWVWLHKIYYPLRFKARAAEVRGYLKRSDPSPRSALTTRLEALENEARAKPFRGATKAAFFPPSGTCASPKPADTLDARRRALAARLEAASGDSSPARRLGLLRKVPLVVDRRVGVFDSAVPQLLAAAPERLRVGLNVRFLDDGGLERGVDSGGLSREFFALVCSELAADVDSMSEPATPDGIRGGRSRSRSRCASIAGSGQPMLRGLPDACLMLAPSDRPPSVYLGLGRLFGLSVALSARGEASALDLPVSSCLVKCACDHPFTADDVRAVDPVFFRNRLEAVLAPGGPGRVADALGLDGPLTFVDDDGEELVANGADIAVDESNRERYVQLFAESYLCGAVRFELAQFVAGFREVVPLDALRGAGLSWRDVALLLEGVKTVDVDALEARAVVKGSGEVAAWFFDVLRDADDEFRARVLQFATGAARLPPGGRLAPPLELAVDASLDARLLPTAHTCFNQLALPRYASKAALREKLVLAATEGGGSFSLI